MSELDDWMEEDDKVLYRGETKPRNVSVAMFMALLNPGLGYAYVGHLVRGLVANFLLVLMLEVAVIAHAVLKFEPLLPSLCVVLAWVVFGLLAALDVRDILEEEGTEEYLLRPFNHWLPYTLIVVLCTMVPVYVTIDFALNRLWLVSAARHDGMYPTLLQGDLLLVDRRGAVGESGPPVGRIVSIAADTPGAPVHHLRVVGVPGDKVRVEPRALYINEEPIHQAPVGEGIVTGVPPRDGMITMLERNRDVTYPVSVSREVVDNARVEPTFVENGRVFLLLDNRSQAPVHEEAGAKMRDAREFGPQRAELVRGAPLFVLWSTDPDSGAIRWDRIGKRVQ